MQKHVSKMIQQAEAPLQAEGLGKFCSEVVLNCVATQAFKSHGGKGRLKRGQFRGTFYCLNMLRVPGAGGSVMSVLEPLLPRLLSLLVQQMRKETSLASEK